MKDLLGHDTLWYPLSFLGFSHPFFGINSHTVIFTWIALLALVVLCFIGRYFLSRPLSVGGHLLRVTLRGFIDLIEQGVGNFVPRYYLFIGSLFLFILACNWIALIPNIEEPTKDLNTTLACGISAFLYTQKEIIHLHGFKEYLREYFIPFSFTFPFNLIAGLALLPLKLLEELASVISISFRLFGNIFGGSIIIAIYQQAIGNSLALNLLGVGTIGLLITLFFIIFEGFLQAFVFSILTITNLSMAIHEEEVERSEV